MRKRQLAVQLHVQRGDTLDRLRSLAQPWATGSPLLPYVRPSRLSPPQYDAIELERPMNARSAVRSAPAWTRRTLQMIALGVKVLRAHQRRVEAHARDVLRLTIEALGECFSPIVSTVLW